MTHTSNERATETVLFAGMCARVHETTHVRAISDGPRNFEFRSRDEDDTRARIPSPNYHTNCLDRFKCISASARCFSSGIRA
ncbi:hypothetical protein TNCV_1854861 [Trichonephila clavipes]|nr:hypothetical protein TNCV_1854861 [Trichonephila clavipes]